MWTYLSAASAFLSCAPPLRLRLALRLCAAAALPGCPCPPAPCPFAKPMKLSQLLALTEDGGAESGTRFSGHGWWVSKEDDAALQLKMAMPGLGKEHVKVTVDKNILLIKGEGVKDPEDGKGPSQYSRRIQLPAEAFKMDQIMAKMDNGVLKVTVPKIKDEERKDVFQIKVE